MGKNIPQYIIGLCLVLLPGFSVFGEDIRDVKPPVDFPSNYFLLFLILFLLLGAGLVFLAVLFIRRNRARKGKTSPPLPPWTVAYERLEKLKAAHLSEAGRIKEYYTILSDITRRYIEDRFNIRAPEMTTEEFLISLKTSGVLSLPQKEALKDFLQSCDMVKFAKHAPGYKEMDESFSSTRRLVDETKGEEHNLGTKNSRDMDRTAI